MSLIVTCARNLEDDASQEIKNILGGLGDNSPEILISDMSGIISVQTSLDSFEVCKKIREKIIDEPWSLRYCLRLIPIQVTVETEIKQIVAATQKLINVVKPEQSFRISVEKRNSEISTREIISKIAGIIPNKVSLKNPDWIILVEILANKTGIAIIKKDDIVSVEIIKRSLSD